MSGPNLVTVAILDSPTEAKLAKNRLEFAGIHAYLADETTPATALHLTDPLGGIKLQVAEQDADDALAILEQQTPRLSEEEKTGFATAATLEKLAPEPEEIEEPATPREKLAEKTLRTAVFGFLFFPILFYSFYLMCQVAFSPERLAGKPRRQFKFAVLINGTVILVGFLMFLEATVGPFQLVDELDALPRPAELVGKWTGQVEGMGPDVQVELVLRRNGLFRFKESGAIELDGAGVWAFQKHTLLVHFNRTTKGHFQNLGKIVGWPTEMVNSEEIVLHDPTGNIRLTRQR